MFRADCLAGGKFKLLAHFIDKRLKRKFVFGFVFIDFIDHQYHRRMLRQLLQHHAVGIGKAHGFHHKNHHIHAAQRFGYVLIKTVIQGIAVIGLKTRRIDKHKLRRVVGVNTGYTVARGLCFFTGNTDFLTD